MIIEYMENNQLRNLECEGCSVVLGELRLQGPSNRILIKDVISINQTYKETVESRILEIKQANATIQRLMQTIDLLELQITALQMKETWWQRIKHKLKRKKNGKKGE